MENPRRVPAAARFFAVLTACSLMLIAWATPVFPALVAEALPEHARPGAKQIPELALEIAPETAIVQNLSAGAAVRRVEERDKALALHQAQENKQGINSHQGVERPGSSDSGGVQDIVVAIVFGLAALILVTRRRNNPPTPDR